MDTNNTETLSLSHDMVASFDTLSKEDATRLLSGQYNIRNVMRDYVARLSRSFEEERYFPVNTILLDRQGRLRDGQHRLTAFVRSSVEKAQFLVIKNVPEEAVNATDTGVKRTKGLVLKAVGFKDSAAVAALVRADMARVSGYIGPLQGAYPSFDAAETLSYALDNRDLLEEALRVARGITKLFPKYVRPVAAASTYLSAMRCFPDTASHVARLLFSEPVGDEGLWAQQAVAKFARSANRLVGVDQTGTKGLAKQVHDDAWLIHTYNLAHFKDKYMISAAGTFQALKKDKSGVFKYPVMGRSSYPSSSST